MQSLSILRLHICSINVYQILCWIQWCLRIQMKLCWFQSFPAFLKIPLKIGLMNPYDSLRKYFESNEWNQNSKKQMLCKEHPLNQLMKFFIHSFVPFPTFSSHKIHLQRVEKFYQRMYKTKTSEEVENKNSQLINISMQTE